MSYFSGSQTFWFGGQIWLNLSPRGPDWKTKCIFKYTWGETQFFVGGLKMLLIKVKFCCLKWILPRQQYFFHFDYFVGYYDIKIVLKIINCEWSKQNFLEIVQNPLKKYCFVNFIKFCYILKSTRGPDWDPSGAGSGPRAGV